MRQRIISRVKIAENLREEMRRQGLSEYALWKRSGVHQPTIHRILSGETRNPKAHTLDRLATTLGMSRDDLFNSRPKRDGLHQVREEVKPYSPTQAIDSLIQSVPANDRAHFRWLLTRLLNRPS